MKAKPLHKVSADMGVHFYPGLKIGIKIGAMAKKLQTSRHAAVKRILHEQFSLAMPASRRGPKYHYDPRTPARAAIHLRPSKALDAKITEFAVRTGYTCGMAGKRLVTLYFYGLSPLFGPLATELARSGLGSFTRSCVFLARLLGRSHAHF